MSFAPSSSGGEYAHALTAQENGPHSHSWSGVNDGAGLSTKFGKYPFRIYQDKASNWTGSWDCIASSGDGKPHNNVQPYITVSRWVRIS